MPTRTTPAKPAAAKPAAKKESIEVAVPPALEAPALQTLSVRELSVPTVVRARINITKNTKGFNEDSTVEIEGALSDAELAARLRSVHELVRAEIVAEVDARRAYEDRAKPGVAYPGDEAMPAPAPAPAPAPEVKPERHPVVVHDPLEQDQLPTAVELVDEHEARMRAAAEGDGGELPAVEIPEEESLDDHAYMPAPPPGGYPPPPDDIDEIPF
jgi:hypothetical protein